MLFCEVVDTGVSTVLWFVQSPSKVGLNEETLPLNPLSPGVLDPGKAILAFWGFFLHPSDNVEPHIE